MKTILNTLCFFLIVFNLTAQETIKLSDFEMLDNTSWKGSLTYKDYQSGELVKIDATMQITLENEKINSFMQYTYEPNKNYKSSVKIKKNGTYYGDEKIVSNTYENNTRIIITMYKGRDNNKKATIYKTYKFNNNTFSVTKEVVFKKTKERLTRNTYTFTKL